MGGFRHCNSFTYSLKFSTAPAFTSKVLQSTERQTVCGQVLFTCWANVSCWAGISTELARHLAWHTAAKLTAQCAITHAETSLRLNMVVSVRETWQKPNKLPEYQQICDHFVHITSHGRTANFRVRPRNQESDQSRFSALKRGTWVFVPRGGTVRILPAWRAPPIKRWQPWAETWLNEAFACTERLPLRT